MCSSCIVICCENIGTHNLPSDEIRRAQWIQAIEHLKPGLTIRRFSRICSAHFKTTDFRKKPMSTLLPDIARKPLQKTAIPTLFPWRKAPLESPSTPPDTWTDDLLDSKSSVQGSIDIDPAKIKATYARVPPIRFLEMQPFSDAIESVDAEDPLNTKIEDRNWTDFDESDTNDAIELCIDKEISPAEMLELFLTEDVSKKIVGLQKNLRNLLTRHTQCTYITALKVLVVLSKENLFKWQFSDGLHLECICRHVPQTMNHLVSCPAHATAHRKT